MTIIKIRPHSKRREKLIGLQEEVESLMRKPPTGVLASHFVAGETIRFLQFLYESAITESGEAVELDEAAALAQASA